MLEKKTNYYKILHFTMGSFKSELVFSVILISGRAGDAHIGAVQTLYMRVQRDFTTVGDPYSYQVKPIKKL